jgi:TatD DNase family protein
MLTDAHCHPFDLVRVYPEAEEERRQLNVLAAASSCDWEEFSYIEGLAGKAADGKAADGAASVLPCFAVHPQMPALAAANGNKITENMINESIETLHQLAAEGRIAAVGECGFDLYNAQFRETEAAQDGIFAVHLGAALRYGLPLVIHARHAMHKVFAAAAVLKKYKAVIFHSWPGNLDEVVSLLQRGVNAYFSFGNVIRLNHRQAMRCCAMFPVDRVLTETDAPFQAPKGWDFSHWQTCPASLRPPPPSAKRQARWNWRLKLRQTSAPPSAIKVNRQNTSHKGTKTQRHREDSGWLKTFFLSLITSH